MIGLIPNDGPQTAESPGAARHEGSDLRRHVITSSRHHVITSSRHHVITSSRHHVIRVVLSLRMTYLGHLACSAYWNDLCVPNCHKLKSGKFEIFSNLMTGIGSFLHSLKKKITFLTFKILQMTYFAGIHFQTLSYKYLGTIDHSKRCCS